MKKTAAMLEELDIPVRRLSLEYDLNDCLKFLKEYAEEFLKEQIEKAPYYLEGLF